MKTAISIPDDLFREADDLARRQGKSRSQLYREALSEYLVRRNADEVTWAMDETLAALGNGAGLDSWSRAAAAQTLERSDWEW